MCRTYAIKKHRKDDGTRDLTLEALDWVYAVVNVVKILGMYLVGLATRQQLLSAMGYGFSEGDDFDEAVAESCQREEEKEEQYLVIH